MKLSPDLTLKANFISIVTANKRAFITNEWVQKLVAAKRIIAN